MRFKFGIIFLLLIIQPVSALCKEGEIKTENKQTSLLHKSFFVGISTWPRQGWPLFFQ
jgi:hypothetical protein